MLNRAIGRNLARDAFQLSSSSTTTHLPLPFHQLVTRLNSLRINKSHSTRLYATDAVPKTPRAAKSSTKTVTKKATPTKSKLKKPKKPTKAKKTTKPKSKKTKAAPKPKKKKVVKLAPHKILLQTVARLKKVALLDEPKGRPHSAYLVFNTAAIASSKGQHPTIATNAKARANEWHDMSATQREPFEKTADQNRAANITANKSWIESHTPDEIRLANAARRRLNAISKQPIPEGRKSRLVSSHHLLKDARSIKIPGNSYAIFVKERYATGDFRGQNIGDVGKALGREWKAMASSEKQVNNL